MIEWDHETELTARKPTQRQSGERDQAYLIVVAGAHVGEMFKLAKPHVIVGRGSGADIQILDEGISRRHASIRQVEAEVLLEDLGSRNGTFLNGQKVERQPLRDGDKIQVGTTTVLKFTYHDHLDESFQRQMYEAALRDALTKAFNKRYFLERLESEFRFAKRHATPLSLILFDIDHFKRINETHGPGGGDFVLSTLGRHVQETIRNEDVFARYGGEEFGVICRAIDLTGAAVLAERVRTLVAGSEFRYQNSVIPVSISLGVSGIPQMDIADPLGMISAADEALDTAKRTGRNRVVTAGGGLLPPPRMSDPSDDDAG